MSDKLRKWTLLCAVLFTLVSMSVMLVYAKDKVITVADVSQDQIGSGETSQTQETEKEAEKDLHTLKMQSDTETEKLCIPLKSGFKAENIIIENRYMSRELWIAVEGGEASFYEKQEIVGDDTKISTATYEETKTGVLLKFQLTDVYECRNELKNDKLYIELVKPGEIYDKIVVIDPACGGTNQGCGQGEWTEKEIALDVARRLKEKLDATDIKVYYTRTEDTNVDEADRIGLANAVKADMFISIGAGEDLTDETKYGTEAVYNDTYFIPGFGSVDCADLVEREVVTAISGRGNGLIPAGGSDIVVYEATVPAVFLKLGYLSNPQEAALLAREDYRQRAAEGIYNAILKAYEGEEK